MENKEIVESTEKKSTSKRLVSVIIALSIVIVVLLFLLGINGGNKKKGGMPGAPSAAGTPAGMPGKGKGGFDGGPTVTPVKAVVAKNTVLHDYVITNGEVETQTAIEVFPSIGGKVVQMNVSLGSPVKQGDVIAYIDPSEAGSSYQKSPVVAPISGSIISSPVKTGQKVSASSVVTKIGDIENLQITASVPERYVADLSIGLKAEISLEAYPGIVFPATVVRISPVLDATTRTKEVILNFDDKDLRVNAGMFAKIKLYTVDYAGKIAIPQDALTNQGDKYFLYVVKEDNTVEKREVTLGKNVGGYYQILSGINAGETVVTAGMLTLSNGSSVKVIQ
ncbi:MAG: efflux RND transporter periplasmic adaptor subunit [Treponema sp.]|nr:efflux RND transporter periplasmic adaptor subunit [Treponema sp.]